MSNYFLPFCGGPLGGGPPAPPCPPGWPPGGKLGLVPFPGAVPLLH